MGRNGFDEGKYNFEGYWKGWVLKIKTFLGPEMATSEASAIWARKSRDVQGPPTPFNILSNGFDPIKIIKSKRCIKRQGT